jgi:hypothetical protein
MTSLEILNAIARRDPDGMPDEPSQADYDAHKRWAIDAYGIDAWREYNGDAWAPYVDA